MGPVLYRSKESGDLWCEGKMRKRESGREEKKREKEGRGEGEKRRQGTQRREEGRERGWMDGSLEEGGLQRSQRLGQCVTRLTPAVLKILQCLVGGKQ
jgi:hypothetical protein